MLSPENIPPPPENQANNPKTLPAAEKPPQEQPHQKCPRCDSANTKFCYYNNYSLTQPRHFCKTCRRYWTRGGALRSVPIGGGCRKTKKLRSSSTSTSSSKLFSSREDFGPGFKFASPNLNPDLTPAVGFNLGGLSLPKLHPATAGVFTQFITSSNSMATPSPCGHGIDDTSDYFGLDLIGLNYSLQSISSPLSNNNNNNNNNTSPLVQSNNIGGNEHNISISSIESLSSINQEMHWKLQQQRLSMIYGTSLHDNGNIISEGNETFDHQGKTQGRINIFENSEFNNNNDNDNNNNSCISETRKNDVGPTTEWLFDQIQTTSSFDNAW